jgi:hypothetical protein
MRLCRITVCLWILIVYAVEARAADDSENASSNSANNPIEPKLTLEYWNYYATSLSDLNGTAENGLGRFLIPWKITGIQELTHIVPPVVTNPTATSGPRTGLGDTQIYELTLGSFAVGLPQKVTLAFGPLVVIPTRTNSNFGTDKLQAGVAGGGLAPQSWGILGVLATWQQTVSGPTSHETTVQPNIFYNLSHGFYLRSSAIMIFDTATHTTVVPVGFGLGKVMNLDGGYALNLYAEAQPSFYRTGVGAPNFQVFTGIKLQLPPAFTSEWHIF